MVWRIFVCGVFVSFMLSASACSQELWLRKDGSIRNIDTRSMAVDEGALYLATKSEIYRAHDAKDKWETIFSIPSGSNEVTCLAVRKKNIYIGTRRGLFRSSDYGNSWKNVFRTIIPEKNNVALVEISKYNPAVVMIATAKGVFWSDSSGDNWRDASGSLKGKVVNSIALNKESAFAAAEDGLYVKKGDPSDWERIYVKSAAEKRYEEDAPEYAEETVNEAGGISCVTLKGTGIYVGAEKKILFSDDDGKSWKNFSCEGLAGTINYLLASETSEALYCAATKGVFEYSSKKNRWIELYKGTDRVFNVKRLVFGGEGERDLWALTDTGLYRLEPGKYIQDGYIDVERDIKALKMLFAGEPAYPELQRAAMKFAEVSPEKISKWRTEARMRALVPKVSFGMANHRSNSYEIYTSATKDYVVSGPDDLYNSLDVSVSWDLGDLIYSDDQTNIDVRSRLTTQLRNDILDDLRRAYFERKRLQFELMQVEPQDMKVRFDKELRIRELTQVIDDLTGNYLSEHMKNPEPYRDPDKS